VVIELEPFRESYSKFDHARFTVLSVTPCLGIGGASACEYYQAIEPERLLFRQKIKERKEREK